MIYLYWYLAIGVAVVGAVLVAHCLTKKAEPDSLRELLDALNPERKRLSYRMLNNVVAPVLASIAILFVWPAAIYLKGKAMLVAKPDSVPNQEREFAVDRSHLMERLTVSQIEDREVVTDPLGAVPSLPFGHLNSVWKTFLQRYGTSDEVWSFTACWQKKWVCNEIRKGYATVRNGVPLSHFMTEWAKLNE